MSKDFLKGALFATLGIMLLQEVSEVIGISSEYLRSKIGIKVIENQAKMSDIGGHQDQESFPIGFSAQVVEDNDDDDDEYEDED